MCYLKECGLNDKTAQHIEYVLVNYVRAQNVFVPDEEILDIVSLPSWTRSFPLHDYIDAPMHLLKGIVSDSMDDSSTWAKLYKCNKKILEVLNVRLEGISKLQLTWLRVLPFRANLTPGGWQSENYIDFSGVQMFNYVVSACDDSVKLGHRPTKELPWVLRFQHLLNCVISRLLVSNEEYCTLGETYAQEVDDYIRVFLTEMDNMSLAMRNPQAWANKANPTSMLNFRQMIVRFGPTRRIWDGNRERYVTFLKPFLVNLRNNETYFGTKLDQINRKKGLTGVIQSFVGVFPEVQLLAPPIEIPNRYTRYRVYSNVDKIMFGQVGVPISALQIRCQVAENTGCLISDVGGDLIRLFVVYRIGRNRKVLRELNVEDDHPHYVHDQKFLQAFPVTMSATVITADMTFVETNLVRSVVLLPYAAPEGCLNDDPLYWLWSDDRKVLKSGGFQFPSVDPEAFKSTTGFPISTWGGTGGIVLPRLNNVNQEEESEEDSEESEGVSDDGSDEDSDESDGESRCS